MFTTKDMEYLDLQLFADGGGEGGADGAGASTTGVDGTDAGSQESTSQSTSTASQESVQSPEDIEAEFEELIKGKFKDAYGSRVQSVVQQRLKGQSEKLGAYDAIAQSLAQRYSIEDASDLEAISKALDADDGWLEDEALDKGIPVETLKQIKSLEASVSRTRAQEREAQAQAEFQAVMADIEDKFAAVKSKYPNADFRSEMNNETFARMCFSGFDPLNAFEAVHHQELMDNAIQQASKTAITQATQTVRSGMARPVEGGAASNAGAVEQHVDPSKFSLKDIREIMKRVQSGEKINF